MTAFDGQPTDLHDDFYNRGARLAARGARRDRPRTWPWLIAGLMAGYVWGLGSRADIVREDGYKEGAAAAWAACESRQTAAVGGGAGMGARR